MGFRNEREVVEYTRTYLNELDFSDDFVITGATGLIGTALIQVLLVLRKERNSNFKIYALCRSETKLKQQFGEEVIFSSYNLLEPIECTATRANIIHAAAPTSSDRFLNDSYNVSNEIVASTKHISDFAIRSNASTLTFLSTLEIYGEPKISKPLKESDYFGLDPLNSRNSYAISKQLSENMLNFLMKKTKIKTNILRLSQVFGPAKDIDDQRVIFYFARQVSREEDIILQTSGSTIRNYIYYLDMIYALLHLIRRDRGNTVEVYNVAHPDTIISIYDLACVFSDRNKKTKVKIQETGKAGYRDEIYLAMDVSKLIKTEWYPVFDLDACIDAILFDMSILENCNKKNTM